MPASLGGGDSGDEQLAEPKTTADHEATTSRRPKDRRKGARAGRTKRHATRPINRRIGCRSPAHNLVRGRDQRWEGLGVPAGCQAEGLRRARRVAMPRAKTPTTSATEDDEPPRAKPASHESPFCFEMRSVSVSSSASSAWVSTKPGATGPFTCTPLGAGSALGAALTAAEALGPGRGTPPSVAEPPLPPPPFEAFGSEQHRKPCW